MLLVESDADRRRTLSQALRHAGLPVLEVSSIAEVERWPIGEIVITEARRFTRWWKQIGAAHVIVLANTPEEGAAACAAGATTWIQRSASPDRLVSLLQSFVSRDRASRDEAR
jgi:DNA-binding response OmpR family regulator